MGGVDSHQFAVFYRPIFDVACPLLCAVGLITNCLNVLILTRKRMISSTNVLLVWLAVADWISMLTLLMFNIERYRLNEFDCGPLDAMRVVLFCMVTSVLFHSMAIWLAVVLALFRSLVVYFPLQAPRWCTISKVNIAAGIVFIVMNIVGVPNASSYIIVKVNWTDSSNETVPLNCIDLRSKRLHHINLIVHALACKLLPCLLLLILNVLLIRGMSSAKNQHRELLRMRNSIGISRPDRYNINKENKSSSSSTGVLVAVITLSILTETPQGILMLWHRLNTAVGRLYQNLGDLLDTLTIINSGINFLLYCTMSSKFRQTFADMLKKTAKICNLCLHRTHSSRL